MFVARMLVIPFCAGLFFGTSTAQDRDRSDCVVKTNSAWGQACEPCQFYTADMKRDHSGTFSIELQNTCNDLLEVKVAMQEQGGTWRIFPTRVLAGNESLNAFACKGTGKYMYWARRVNDTELVIPTDQQIISENRGR